MNEENRNIGMVDRRDLLGAAGIGLLLAGCGGDSKVGKTADGKACIPPDGYCSDHGDSPSMSKPFTAKEMCVVYIQFDGSLAPKVIQGYIKDLTPSTDLKDLANRALKQLAGTESGVTFYKKRYNFDRLSFRAPTKVVVFVNDPETAIRFSEESPGTKSNYVIRFTHLTGMSFKPNVPHFRNTKLNKNFYNVDRITISGLIGKTAYWINFLNRKNETAEQLKDIDPNNHHTWWIYSMNIHLLVKVQQVTMYDPEWIPLVLDPDTGNMGSDP